MDKGLIMSDYIFKANKSTQEENTVPSNVFYTLYGDQDWLDDEGRPCLSDSEHSKVYAKQSNDKYYVKVGTYGRLFNPIGMYSEDKQTKFISKMGKHEFEFRKVNAKVFDLYVNFLRTKNIAWLNNAERENT